MQRRNHCVHAQITQRIVVASLSALAVKHTLSPSGSVYGRLVFALSEPTVSDLTLFRVILSWAGITVASLKLLSAVRLFTKLWTLLVRGSSSATRCTTTELFGLDLTPTSEVGKAQALSSTIGLEFAP